MDHQTQLNNFLKKTRFNFLQFEIQNNNNDPINPLYKANLKLIIENKPLRGESNWESSIEEAKNQCSKRVLDILISDPHADINKPPEKEPFLKEIYVSFISIILNIFLIVYIFPYGFYIILPFLVLISIFLTVPWIVFRNKRILMSTGNRVIVRKTKSYESFILPIKYVNHRDFVIDISNGQYEDQDIDKSNFIAIAKKYIFLNLVQTQENGNEGPIYKIVPGRGFRVRKSEGGSYSSSLKLVKENGKVLYYYNIDIAEDTFVPMPIPIFKVMSKSGIHYFPEQYCKPIDMNSFVKYQTIISIHFDWLISFFHF
ncbi:hypothetical protein ACTFIV_004202 [Dictyostelium citrinum]